MGGVDGNPADAFSANLEDTDNQDAPRALSQGPREEERITVSTSRRTNDAVMPSDVSLGYPRVGGCTVFPPVCRGDLEIVRGVHRVVGVRGCENASAGFRRHRPSRLCSCHRSSKPGDVRKLEAWPRRLPLRGRCRARRSWLHRVTPGVGSRPWPALRTRRSCRHGSDTGKAISWFQRQIAEVRNRNRPTDDDPQTPCPGLPSARFASPRSTGSVCRTRNGRAQRFDDRDVESLDGNPVAGRHHHVRPFRECRRPVFRVLADFLLHRRRVLQRGP